MLISGMLRRWGGERCGEEADRGLTELVLKLH